MEIGSQGSGKEGGRGEEGRRCSILIEKCMKSALDWESANGE